MTNRLTRRDLLGAAAAVAAAIAPAAEAQNTTSSKDDDLKSARDTMANNSAQLAKVEVPIATEPAFLFRAQ